MGLSSNEVSIDGLDWSQTLELSTKPQSNILKRQHQQINNQQQQMEQLKCPRCDSTNTKFCYYNNYNKSQPRHFCKACKRHWTRGGTLRNIPVGGGRKNKRQKTSKAAVATAPAPLANANNINIINKIKPHMAIQVQQLQQRATSPNLVNANFTNGNVLGSMSTQGLQFSSFETNPFSISSSLIQSSNVLLNFNGGSVEDSTITSVTTMPTTTSGSSTINSTTNQPWQVIPRNDHQNSCMDFWDWENIGSFGSTDINIQWD